MAEGMSAAGRKSALWEKWVGLLVALGSLATIGLAVFETYWG
jgi:hypothetical protein